MRFLPYDLGPIRPPSESGSFLLRVQRNCPWNRCLFCVCYKGTRFEKKSLEEIRGDLDRAALFYGRRAKSVRRAFLQDADPLVLPADDLIGILSLLKERLPSLERVTAYGRAASAFRKPDEDFRRLREAGLKRLHLGMESGYGPVLERMRKGATPEMIVEAGRKIRGAGIELSLYVMPGLGGRRWWREHARSTAEVLNRIGPDFIRLRTLSPIPGTPLFDLWRSGDFEMAGEDDIVREIRLLVETLDGTGSVLTSDHVLNLLEEVEGRLPEERERILSALDRFLALPGEARREFAALRRMGFVRSIDEIKDPEVRSAARNARAELEKRATAEGRSFDEVLHDLRRRVL